MKNSCEYSQVWPNVLYGRQISCVRVHQTVYHNLKLEAEQMYEVLLKESKMMLPKATQYLALKPTLRPVQNEVVLIRTVDKRLRESIL